MSELKQEREAELRKCISERIGLSTPEAIELFAALDAARRERDAWRAATGLASLTPEQAGERIDAMDDRLAAAEEVVVVAERLCCAMSECRRVEMGAGGQTVSENIARTVLVQVPISPYLELNAALARAAAWREGKQPVTGGDMARAVELLRGVRECIAQFSDVYESLARSCPYERSYGLTITIPAGDAVDIDAFLARIGGNA